MKFQSVGSQYNFVDAWRHLFAHGGQDAVDTLTSVLQQRFGGTAYLYSNGRSALAAALRPVVTASDEVAINSFTCYVVQEAVHTAGAKPLFLDIDLSTLNFSETQLNDAIASHPNLRAIIVQNTFGIACDIVAIERFAHEHGIVLIEDLAHSVGLVYSDGRQAGTVGDFIMLSFGRDKLLDCVSGGALVIRNQAYAEKIQAPVHLPAAAAVRRDRWYPMLMWLARTTYPVGIGKLLMHIYRTTGLVVRTADGSIDPLCTMPAWQARRVSAKLEQLDTDLNRRQKIIDTYTSKLASSLHHSGAPVRFAFLAKNRTRVLNTLRSHHFYFDDTWYDTPIGPARLFEKVDYPEQSCPHAVSVAQSIINLPTHRGISPDDAGHIADIIQGVERESV